MCSPSPVLPRSRPVVKNGSKILGRCSGAMPLPSSEKIEPDGLRPPLGHADRELAVLSRLEGVNDGVHHEVGQHLRQAPG